MSKRALILALVGILTLALGLRIWGIGFGLPYAYHIDELPYVRTALKLGAGILSNPPYDPTGFANILFVEYGTLYVIARLLNVFQSVQDFKVLYRSNPTVFLLLSRLTSALLGTATVLVVYILGKRTRSEKIGLLAAALLAVSFLHIKDSHYGTPDIAMTFFITLCVTLCVGALDNRTLRNIILSGIAGGLAVSVKWTALPVILPILWIGIIGSSSESKPAIGWGRFKIFSISMFGFTVGSLLGSIQIVLNPGTYWSKVSAEFWTAKAPGFMGIWQVDTVSGWLFYVKTLSYGLGVVLLALATLGFLSRLVLLWQIRDRISGLLLCFPLTYYLLMGFTHHYFARYALPLIPFTALFAAEAIVAIKDLLVKRPRLGRGLSILLVAAAIAQPLSQSIRSDWLLTRQDTRTLANQWIEAVIPEGAKIAVDWPTHGPPLSTLETAVPRSSRVYDVTVVGGAGLSDHPVTWYREQSYDYLIASSYIYNIPLVFEEQDANRRAFYTSLDHELELVQELRPFMGDVDPPFIFDEIYGPFINLWQRERPGPVIKIYRVR